MADVVEDVERLLSLPDDQHWLCPRNGHDIAGRYFDEDVYDELATESQTSKTVRLTKVKEAEARKLILLNALRIFAFDGTDAIKLQKQLLQRLSGQLSDCDVCVRIYHKSRSELKDQLEQQFEADDVANFMTMFDDMNIKRIKEGLHKARVRLESLPVSRRSVKALDMESTYALFEALSCRAFICNEQLLAEHFDPPFQMVQVNKRLILQTYLPATTHFLFSSNPDRCRWAVATWGKMRRPPTLGEFDWAIKEPLLTAMGRVQIYCMESGFAPKFWSGLQLILSKLNKDLITHAIRGMEYDIYKLALDHLQIDPVAFLDVVRALSTLITLSPSDFWDSMGTISPATIVEQIFGSPVMEYILMSEAGDDNVKGPVGHSEVLGWIIPFITSIKASSNRIPACRTLVQQLMAKWQAEKFPQVAKSACFNKGLEVLNLTLQALMEGKTDATFVGNASVYDILSLVLGYADPILELTKGLENKDVPEDKIPLPLQVIQKALALDCLTLTIYHRKVFEKQKLGQDKETNSGPLWQKVIEGIRSGGAQSLASHALLGALDLTGLEKFIQNKESPLTKDRVEWNFAFQARCEYMTNILDRISNFEGFAIAGMFKSQYLARAIVAPLLSSNEDTRQAAVAVYKTLALEDGRREAIRYIMEHPYERFLRALADVVKMLISKKAYTPMTALIRLSSDIHESLCNSQNGILRSKNLTDLECEATKIYWRATWRALSAIFKSTERWSFQGHEKTEIMDFCKGTMQFVDAFFDSYDIFVNAIAVVDDHTGKDNSAEVASQLLSIPRDAMEFMAVWLRFRDEYLADKIVKLVSKLLVKLRDINQECTDNTLDYLKRVILGDVKTKLTPQQTAQLERSWEIHTRSRISRPEQKQAVAAKQASLNQWIAADKQKQRQLDMKDVLADSTRAAQLYKERMLPKAAAIKPKEGQRPLLDAAAIKKRKEEVEARKRADTNRARALRGDLPKPALDTKEKQQKGDGVMVSSDEESDGERKAKIDELFGLSNDSNDQKSSTSHIFADVPAPAPRPVKVQRIMRSAKDMRARLAPDLGPLHKEILSWDFFYNGEFPQGSDPDQYKAVPKKFRNVLEYKEVFRPLLTLEAWQGIVKTRAELSSRPYEATVVTRATVNAFIEISTTVAHSDDPDQRPSEGDVVLFSTSNTPHLSEKQPHCLARVLEVKRKKQHLEVLYRAMPNPSNPQFGAKSVVFAVKIQSIIPLEREFGALVGLEYYDLAEFILNARPSHLLEYTDAQLDPIGKNYELNKAQAKAVKSALDNDAFTLIQGPPGSGKTKTIVAIVGALLSDSFRDQGTAVHDPMGKSNSSSSRPAKKLLVCAPSNAAVDELVMRFKQGIRTMSGHKHKINVVRLGRSDAINTQVLDVTLDELVKERLRLNGANENARAETQKITKEHQEVSEKLRFAREKESSGTVKNADDLSQLLSEIQALARRKKELGNLRDAALDKEQGEHRAAELARKQARQAILDSAHVICATLSGSGHEMFQNLNLEFETVVVDEAAQCVEMSALIPLKYGCAKCILVGDPKQLPPTVFSREAQRFQYEQSLFQRMQMNDSKAVHMLDTQYRMHPEISLFPSTAFYDKRLLDGPDMDTLRQRPWHANDLFGPYVFFNVAGKHQTAGGSKSLINRAEIEIADALYNRLNLDHEKSYDFKGKIGIITPYKGQLNELKAHFKRRYGPEITKVVEFNTTDAFQGRESEIIIFSCVRAQDEGSVGFLQDIRRMNVGLTRAKSSLWVLGNADTLKRGEFWRKMIEDAKARDRFLIENQYMGPLKDPQGSMPIKLRPAEPKDVTMVDAPPAPVASLAATAPTAQMMLSNDLASDSETLIPRQPVYSHGSERRRTPPRMGMDGTSSNRGSSVDSARSSDSRDPSRGRPPVKRRPMPMDNNPLLPRKKPKKD